jgi:hypothetical protein
MVNPQMRFEECPECHDVEVRRLPKDWQQQVFRGVSIPVLNCGNPWHYLLPSEITNIGEYDPD